MDFYAIYLAILLYGAIFPAFYYIIKKIKLPEEKNIFG